MTRILGLSGSLRRASFNSGLLRAAAELAPEGVRIEIGSIEGVPLYDADLEKALGAPAPVAALRSALETADGLMLFSPEYNGSIPGVFKNAIDWISSGESVALFRNKPVAILGASPGGLGTALGQVHCLPVLRALGARPWQEQRLMVSGAESLFDRSGDLTDENTRKMLARFVAGFADSLRR
ncbi:MAG: NADPH-dependent FMN reductase [Paracoccus sp. (in: a-proteobacteria)]|nr:NADPH-dependent FMN reductase [Paracoccus sp. (in: a-proteobacteria)]